MGNRTRAKKDKRLVKPKLGPLPEVLGKGAPHRDRTKYTRKQKHGKQQADD